MRDRGGRPLGEGRARAAVRADVEMDMRACPYAGRRHGLPMNVSALRQMTERWDEVMAGLRALRAGAVPGGAALRHFGEAVEVAVACVALAPFEVLRGDGPARDGEISEVHAAIYKVAAGVVGVVRSLAVRAARGEEATVGARAIIEHAETTGRLVAAGEACAAPPALLSEAMAALFDPAPSAAVSLELRGADRFFDAAGCAADATLLAAAFEEVDRAWERRVLGVIAERGGGALGPLLERARDHLAMLDRAGVAPVAPSAAGLVAWCRRLDPSLGAALAAPMGSNAEAPAELSAALAAWLAPPNAVWVAELLAPYARWRGAYLAAQRALEARAAAALQVAPSAAVAEDRQLFNRLHAHAWLEAAAGARIDLHEDGLTLHARGTSRSVSLGQGPGSW